MITHKGTKTITTERLVLRQYTADDCQDVYSSWGGDAEIAYFMTSSPFKDVEQTRNVLDRWSKMYERPNLYLWAIEMGGKVIGNVNVVQIIDSLESCEIGYCLGKEYHNRGIVTEATRAVIDFLFNEVGVNRIEIEYVTENPASGMVAKKCGFTYEGKKRQAFKDPDGNFHDLEIYSLLKCEYIR